MKKEKNTIRKREQEQINWLQILLKFLEMKYWYCNKNIGIVIKNDNTYVNG